MEEVFGLYVGDAESSKYWLSVFNELKNRGLKDIMILCADGLTGIKESINVAFPNTEYQRCIVHQVRNTLKYVSYKDKREFATDLKSIYLSGYETSKYLLELEKNMRFKINTIQIDNGYEFVNDAEKTNRKTRFQLVAEYLGMKIKRTRPYSPW